MLLKTTKKLLLIDLHVYPLKSRQNVSHVSAEEYRWTGRTSLTNWSHKTEGTCYTSSTHYSVKGTSLSFLFFLFHSAVTEQEVTMGTCPQPFPQ